MLKIVQTKHAPEAIGPYSQAVIFNEMVYCSGQISLDPESMKLIGNDAKEQTEQIMINIGEILKAAGTDYANIIKCSIFLARMDDFSDVNEVYGRYFKTDPPARETVAVQTLPKNAKVEISCIAAV